MNRNDHAAMLPDHRAGVVATMARSGVEPMNWYWAPDAIERVSAVHATVPFGSTASMQRDIMEGRPSELDAQIGSLVRLGERLGVPTPVNRFVYDCLMPQERRARGEMVF